jgi:hypothetical protein
LVALNVRHLQLTLDKPSNVNAIQKPLSGIKNVLQKPHEASHGVSVADLPSFTQNLMQTCCSILPLIADKIKQKIEKAFV